MKLIQIATGMSRELHIDQYSELLLQQSERVPPTPASHSPTALTDRTR